MESQRVRLDLAIEQRQQQNSYIQCLRNMFEIEEHVHGMCVCVSHSVMSNSLRPHGL